MPLSQEQIEKNKAYAEKNGYQLDNMGRIIMQQNVKFRIEANIQPDVVEVKK